MWFNSGVPVPKETAASSNSCAEPPALQIRFTNHGTCASGLRQTPVELRSQPGAGERAGEIPLARFIFLTANEAILKLRTHPQSAVFRSANGAGSWSAGRGGIVGDVVGVFAIAPNAIYAGNLSGVFKSTESGDSWIAKNTGLANTDVRAIVIDPANAMTIYLATGGGVFKSVDGGDSWSAANNGLTRLSVRALAIDAGTTT